MQLPIRPEKEYDTSLSADRGAMVGRAKKKKTAKKIKERKRNRRDPMRKLRGAKE